MNGSAYNNFYDKGSTNCTFVGNTAIQPNAGSWSYSIRISDNPGISSATNSTWQDNTLIYTSGVTFPVRAELNSDTVFVNMTYSTADEAIVGNLTRKWWHRALATINNESYGPINVTINNASGFVYNASAATTGYSNYSALTEYVVTLGTRAYANNYTYNATYNGHDISGDFNISSTTTTSANFVECGTLNYNVTLLYALTQGATNCFVVNQSNLIIDGQGYALTGAIGSASKGIFVNASNFTLRNLTLSNFSYGIYVNSSNATNLTNVRVYGNTVDVFVGSFGGSRQLWLTNLTIDNPLGTLANYSLISVSDVVDADTAYEMVWTNASNVPLTYGFVSMAGKFINLTSSIGAPSIDSFTFYWNDSEVTTGNYTEDNFELWRHNTTLGWTLLNNTPNVTFNYLTYSGLIPTSSYALLERLNESTSSNSSGSINSANNGPSLPIVALPTPITTPEQTIVPPRSAPTPTPQITTATPVVTSTPEPTQIPSATPQVRVVEEDQTDNTIVQAIAIVVAAAIGGAAYYFGKSIIAKAG
ncbi:hypothetical protein AUJ65_03680 [Candidatus Micrarchaeota archaeon CG1_02_51_15]|nr:MAG: hypothetical protein AUJ65_03680 [Candidatus Micrarchaeota archaeon CG1_02_51_15]